MRTVNGKTDRVVIVGAGLSGLSAALQLAGRGRAVTVVERGEHPGGRVGRADIGGYRIDTGPTVLTMPDIIDDAFAAVGRSLAELAAARDTLTAWLAGERDAPPDWPELDIFAPALPHSARHPSIRLAFEAVAEAVAQALARHEDAA